MRFFLGSFFALFSTSLIAALPTELLPNGTRLGLSVATASTSAISINTNQLFPPASTQKLVTALAAKLELGGDFRFITTVEKNNNDLILRFSGDPSLNRKDLEGLVIQLKKQGIHNISGNIWLNNSVFTGYERGVGWPWDILGVCYSAPASAVTLDSNCVQASISTERDGHTHVYVPPHQPITVSTQAISVTKEEQKEKQCDLELLTQYNNNYQLSGCLKQQSKPLPLKFAIQNTLAYTDATLRSLLNKHQISFDGNISQSKTQTGKVIASHYSEPLDTLLETMLQKSTNLIADNIVKTLGARFYSQPGSFNNGTEAVKQIIFSNTGIDLSDAQLADGSGLSRNNRMTVQDLAKVLDYIWKNEERLGLIAMLPIAGESGTLKYRKSMRKAPVKDQIQAKSGSVYGSYNMAGFILDKKGHPKASFVQFVSDYYPPKKEELTPSTPAIFQFENALYKQLIKQYQ